MIHHEKSMLPVETQFNTNTPLTNQPKIRKLGCAICVAWRATLSRQAIHRETENWVQTDVALGGAARWFLEKSRKREQSENEKVLHFKHDPEQIFIR